MLEAPFEVNDTCCAVMKKRPAKKYYKETGKRPILAMLASESQKRTIGWLKTGCNAFELKYPQSQPMAFWTEDMAIEECLELIKAILKFRRSNAKDSDLRDAVIDEIADVQIMLTQLGIIFNCVEEVNERIDFKIDRQMGRIKEREAKRDVC